MSVSKIITILSELRGVPHQSTVGFMTILEALRYCEVITIFVLNFQFFVVLLGRKIPEESHLSSVACRQ